MRSVALIAQSVEQRIENPRVGGSIPPRGTISSLLKFGVKQQQNLFPLSSVGRTPDC